MQKLSNSYTMVCTPVQGVNPRALVSGLSHLYGGQIVVYIGYLLFEVNTKYISSNVLKISVSTSKIADIFNSFDEIF